MSSCDRFVLIAKTASSVPKWSAPVANLPSGATNGVLVAGAVVSHTTIHRPPDPRFEAPYVVADVEVDEGWRMFTWIVGCDPSEVSIGQRVEVCFMPRYRRRPGPGICTRGVIMNVGLAIARNAIRHPDDVAVLRRPPSHQPRAPRTQQSDRQLATGSGPETRGAGCVFSLPIAARWSRCSAASPRRVLSTSG